MKNMKLLITAILVVVMALGMSAYAADVEVPGDYADLSAAYAALDLSEDNTITLTAATAWAAPATPYTGNLTIKGNSASVALSFTEMSVKGNLNIDNVVLTASTDSPIYANGFHLVIGSGVTTSNDLYVYGGGTSAINADTNLEVYGGNWTRIFGGGTAAVKGDTHVIVGGTVNKGESMVDSDSNFSNCYMFGGGNGAAVSGNTYFTCKGSAIAAYIFGAGNGSGSTIGGETNVYFESGNVMNVYGGAHGAAISCNTNVYVTGGVIEAVIGGSINGVLTGNTNVYLLGGEITRRVYTGCYNNNVNGTTTGVISGDVSLCTGTNMSWTDMLNGYVYPGTNGYSDSAETNTIIFIDNCYSSQKSHLKSGYDYLVTAGAGGMVTGTNTAGQIKILPDLGNYGTVNSANYVNSNVSISTGTTTVTFAANYAPTVSASAAANGISVTISGTSNASGVSLGQKYFVSVYDSTGRYIATGLAESAATTNVVFEPKSGETYNVVCRVIGGFANALAPLAAPATTTVTIG